MRAQSREAVVDAAADIDSSVADVSGAISRPLAVVSAAVAGHRRVALGEPLVR